MKLFALVALMSSFAFAQETIIQDDLTTSSPVSTSQESLSKYDTNYKLRQDRKVGAGIGVGGALGGFGGLFELNIEDMNSTVVGFGTGPGYQTLGLSWKRSFEGEYFTPYTTAGYARWWDTGNRSEANRSALLKNFLTEDQKKKNSFGLDLVTGSVGMQYNQLSGDLAGSSFYFEFGALVSIQNTKLMPTGSVGALYYF